MQKRAKQFRAAFFSQGADAALILSRQNIRYLTGFTGEGCVLVGRDDVAIITDFRYIEQAEIQASECVRVCTAAGITMPASVFQMLSAWKAKHLAIGPRDMTLMMFDELKAALPGIEMIRADGLLHAIRAVKDPSEIECIITASEIACKAFEHILSFIQPGVTEHDVRVELDHTMLMLGSEAPAFDSIVCAGKNGALPHAVPGTHVIANGEMVTLDFGAQIMGYKTDMTRTVAVGQISDELKRIYDTVLEAQKRALDAIRPGVTGQSIDKIARDFIDARYPGAFGHKLGHGVGLNIHEWPQLGQGAMQTLGPGNVVTVEPGVYITGVGGCRIEDTIILREGGFINPITSPKELIIL